MNLQLKKSSFYILIFLFFSCQQDKTRSTQILDFGNFTIEAPLDWKKMELKGTDSRIAKILIGSTDTLSFDLGSWSNKLYDVLPTVLDRRSMSSELKDTTGWIIVDDIRQIDMDRYRSTNISWDTIDEKLAKIVYPIRSGRGVTGVYIDSLWPGVQGNIHFSLYGINLKPENEQLVLNAIRTLNFRRR